MVDFIQNDVLGSGDLVGERDELKEMSQTLEQENSMIEKISVKLRKKDEFADSLQEKVK